jgi:hypothetical protein
MSEILKTFTINRNILAASAADSSIRAAEFIDLVGDGIDSSEYASLTKTQTNAISAFASHTGLFEKSNIGGYAPTKLNQIFRDLEASNRPDTWQWLITRSLWHYEIPNGTRSPVNKIAVDQNSRFNFFKTILGVLSSLEGLSREDRFLYFHELLVLLNNDDNWNADALTLFTGIIKIRSSADIDRGRKLLDDLEDEFEVPKDNLNTVLVKAFRQTGLFEYKEVNGVQVGIGISSTLSNVLQKRIRHILDTDLTHADPQSNWQTFIGLHDHDLPLELENAAASIDVKNSEIFHIEDDISQMCESALSDFDSVGLRFELDFIRRFFSACLTKPFVILTGLSGSGKTKLAEAAAAWLSSHPVQLADPFTEGQVIRATRTEYAVRSADRLSVVLETPAVEFGENPIITTLPRALIEEWAEAILSEGFSVKTPAREIRTFVDAATQHNLQINAFESHLKACAFALIDARAAGTFEGGYKVVPVGPDWISSEYVLGYPDALNSENYVRRPALDLILAAQTSPSVPHFLILDEMNLSQVERYFAEILSAIETTQPLDLFGAENGEFRNGVPYRIPRLPKNLFIIGTVNVDETTYLFSPKVLDRANVLEFRVSNSDISAYMRDPKDIDLSKIEGNGAKYSQAFLLERVSSWNITDEIKSQLTVELDMFFSILQEMGSEFGYRVAKEISRFIYHYSRFGHSQDSFYSALDAQVNQKLLPKLHGAERVLKPVLWGLAVLCREKRQWELDGSGNQVLKNHQDIVFAAREAILLNANNPLTTECFDPILPLSFEKCRRMNDRLQRNGFTSYAEA